MLNKTNIDFPNSDCVCLSGEEVLNLLKPCIYGWKEGETWLYIGKTKMSAFMRFCQHKRDYDYPKDIKETYQIFIWPLPNMSEEQLAELEARLISQLQPKMNKHNLDTLPWEARKTIKLVNEYNQLRDYERP